MVQDDRNRILPSLAVHGDPCCCVEQWNVAEQLARSSTCCDAIYYRTRDGDPTELTASLVRAARRCFGLEISPQLESAFQVQNSLVARPGLRQFEYGRSRFDDLGKYDALDVSCAQQFYASVRTTISEPGFSQTPRAALEEAVQSIAVNNVNSITMDGQYVSGWSDGYLELREPLKIGGGPAQLWLTGISDALLPGGTLQAHELEIRRGTSAASDRLARGTTHTVPDASYFASHRNLRRRPRQYQSLRKVFTTTMMCLEI